VKAIKSIPSKDYIFRLLLIASIFILFANLFTYFNNTRNVELDQYDVMLSCESVPVPVFSVPEGIYEQPFELQIQAPEGHNIFYTTDGSIPTVRSNRYRKSIKVNPQKNLNKEILSISNSTEWIPPSGRQNHCVVLRARCFRDGVGYGKVKNVIYSPPTINQHHGFQVIHILIEADSLFSPKRGIDVLGQKYYSKKTRIAMDSLYNINEIEIYDYPANYLQRGKNWIRPAEMILTDTAGKTTFEQSVRLCIHGNNTRFYSVRTYRIMPDNIRGDTVINYRFFDHLPYDTFKKILLRSSGNDQRWTMFRDAMVQQISKEAMELDIQEYAPAVLYINGNYWGIRNIREMINENYLEIKYGAALENIDILEGSWSLKYGHDQSLQSFNDLIRYLQENSLADEETYQYVCTQIDIDNFTDYFILETFFAASDWPGINNRPYRIRQQTETMSQKNVEAGKWRWLVFDLDETMRDEPISVNMFKKLKNNSSNNYITIIFFALLENIEFKRKFLDRYEYIITNCFTTQNIMRYIEDFEDRYQYEMDRHIARWRYPLIKRLWRYHVQHMKDFAQERPNIVLEQLKEL